MKEREMHPFVTYQIIQNRQREAARRAAMERRETPRGRRRFRRWIPRVAGLSGARAAVRPGRAQAV